MARPRKSPPPFRADHVGSLLRPPALLEARRRAEQGEITAAELTAAEDAAIREAVALQERAGLGAITDGEFRRGHFLVDFLTSLDGIARTDASYAVAFKGEHGETSETRSMLAVTGKIRRARPASVAGFAFLKSATSRTPKLCIPSPTYLHMRGGRRVVSERAYPDIEEFWSDLVRAYHAEIADLAAAGCTYLQLDEIVYATMCDEAIRARMRADAIDPDEAVRKYAEVVSAIAAGAPENMTVAVHTCRGNHRSMWMAQGGYERVAGVVFAQPHVDALFLEFDTDRAGGFEPLRFVAADKTVVLGLVSSKRPELESKDLLKRRIDEAAKYVPLERLCLSPQCGFASTELGNRITPEIQRRKLELVVEVAQEVWGRAA
ncbi:MAG: 5-methyltetrahydropteroyltriglutamate--homocysteine S-methyltransferase [Burkholderiales bacterium]|nr:5-methyltetrahydropteroyltriglutamate--homocysteine S-methyltransferase [Burkholderiales bacterium]